MAAAAIQEMAEIDMQLADFSQYFNGQCKYQSL